MNGSTPYLTLQTVVLISIIANCCVQDMYQIITYAEVAGQAMALADFLFSKNFKYGMLEEEFHGTICIETKQ